MSTVRGKVSRRRGRPRGPGVDPAERREQLLDAAERVIGRGGRDLAFADIAAEAGYARTAVYAAFPDRAALANALARRHTDRLIRLADERIAQPLPMHDLVHAVIDVVCGFVEHHADLYPLLMQIWVGSTEQPQRPLFADIADWASSALEAVMTAVGADPIPARTWGTSIAGATLLAAEDWNLRRDRSRSALVDELTALTWPGLAAAGLDRFTGPARPRGTASDEPGQRP